MKQTSNQRQYKEHIFNTHDGSQIYYRHWSSEAEISKGAIVMFHRGHEHSARMMHIVDEMEDMKDYDFFAWDARGHGHSDGVLDYSPSLDSSLRDVDSFIHHIQSTYQFNIQDIAVIAQSVGAVLVSTWVHDYAPKIRCMVLASPAFKVKLYVPFALTGLKLMQSIRGDFFVNSYVKSKYLTHDPQRMASYDNDPLITRPIASNILLSLYDTSERIVEDAAAITVPTQLLISGDDWVVHHKPQHQFYERLGSEIKERHILDGFYHDTLGEKDRELALDKAQTFIQQCFSRPYSRPDLTHSDKTGFTRYEADTLATPINRYSLKGLYWAITRMSLKLGELLSNGIKLGHQTGFDSGSTLDYVYENQAQGLTPIGKFIDKTYLNSIGWRGIRQRKLNIEALLLQAIKSLRQKKQAIRIMDVAAGHGRYILEAIKQNDICADSILLRDYSQLNVKLGTQMIESNGLEDIATFTQANAFKTQSYLETSNQPTIGVVSGLYELFPNNDLIRQSLTGFASTIESGGYLIYTNQPWHPQLEMIARALTSHKDGDAWIMRRRTQEEMDQLVASAGFTKIEQRIDEFGIFTVSIAQKD
ncbi:MAG: bifunctional alpha/beta hydrolase/class I SAM-dependent methyltransferase [Gammaproteobacteria bacterium]|nr:bifunctional alpha/beta hydrolase/class I SAM-dependent methyltransferase [Gammaproteobacteria bacterium]